MADISVIDGPVPVVVLIVGAIALVILLARRGRAALVTVAIAAGFALVDAAGAQLAAHPRAEACSPRRSPPS